MEPIQDSFKKLLQNPSFKKEYAELKSAVLANPDVKLFLDYHRIAMGSETVDRSLMKLYEYTTQNRDCSGCESLDTCGNLMPGFEPVLILRNNYIDIAYEPCPRKRLEDEKRKQSRLVKSMAVPRDVLEASMSSLELDDPGRFEAIKKSRDFVKQYLEGTAWKGLYFHGPFGVGKTYFLGAIANELAEKGVSSMIVYTPELIREIKGSMSDGTLNQKLDVIKEAAVLMFDDIGAESMTSWMRDEVLGPVLQFRMMEKLPTFFTSNANFEELAHHFTYTQRGEVEELKAARIMERIRYLAEAVEVGGRNRRS
ncbi:primosomal protein DnaI [Bacillus marinisedimentorum]|uniref:primosomal protein DnaI n=1 Tax=Bacillus marinisedimentorum TaxID=1821260 RepID=UPI000872E8D5|nr:primosomal protein DnaI [Bacillus marinisedimentorum]